ncbi:hypothetical protein [Desulfonema magnum]|nr:hypothetical protein [Desulfonema magnum]
MAKAAFIISDRIKLTYSKTTIETDGGRLHLSCSDNLPRSRAHLIPTLP